MKTLKQSLISFSFPSPSALWEKYKKYKGISSPDEERISSQDYYFDAGGEEIVHRTPNAIMKEIAALDAESAKVLDKIGDLL